MAQLAARSELQLSATGMAVWLAGQSTNTCQQLDTSSALRTV